MRASPFSGKDAHAFNQFRVRNTLGMENGIFTVVLLRAQKIEVLHNRVRKSVQNLTVGRKGENDIFCTG